MKTERLFSSNLKSFAYDEASRALTVMFHSGTSTTYPDVAPETVEGLRNAESPGRFFHANIINGSTSGAAEDGERPLSPRDTEEDE